ncbi:MAG: FxsA family protein [Actinomycetes bacterium]
MLGLVLVVLFLVMPVLEIYVIIQVGQEIGALPTVVLLVLESLLGAWLVKREGRRAWAALRTATGTGRLPSGELADAALVLVGGTLLLTPGFITDVFGFILILPLTRPLARRALGWLVARRAATVAVRHFHVGPGGGPGQWRPRQGRLQGPDIVRGEIVDDDPPPPA